MSKFRSIAKLVATTERMQKSLKKERFEILKNDVKARRQSVAVIPDGDLNSKYEQDAAMESDMQKLYNARYEMSDAELEEMGSGLEDLMEEETEEEKESNDDDYKSESEDENEIKKREEEQKKETQIEKGNESDGTVELDSDIEEMLNKEKELKGMGAEGDRVSSTDDDGDDDDDAEETESDSELERIIQSEDNETAEENEGELEEGQSDDSEVDINYSDLEEEYNSDAFSFTGMTESPSGINSRASDRSDLSRMTNSVGSGVRWKKRKGKRKGKPRKGSSLSFTESENEDINSVVRGTEPVHEATIEEEPAQEAEEESIPDPITYSRSISDIEEYESDVFAVNEEEATWKGGHSEGYGDNDSQGDFSIPRAMTPVSDSDVGDHEVKSETTDFDADELHDFVNEVISRAATGLRKDATEELNSSLEDNQENKDYENNNKDISEERKTQDDDKIDSGENEETTTGERNESPVIEHSTADEGNNIDVENDLNIDADVNNNEPENDPCGTSDIELTENEKDGVKSIHVPYVPKYTYQKMRKKEKRVLKKKQRVDIYERSHDTKYRKKKNGSKSKFDEPDPEIPSYKAKLEAERYKTETIEIIIEDLLGMANREIDKRIHEREEKEKHDIAVSLLDGLLLRVNEETIYRDTKRKTIDLVTGVLDDVMDMWECEIEAIDMMKEEKNLESLSTSIVSATLMVSAREVAGEGPYTSMLKKGPKFKAMKKEIDRNVNKRGKKLKKRKDRRSQVMHSKKESLTELNTANEDTKIEKSSEVNEGEIEKQGEQVKEERDAKSASSSKENSVVAEENDSDDKEREKENEQLIENKRYIELTDCDSSGRSSAATIKRGEGERKIIDKDDEQEIASNVAESLGSQSLPQRDDNNIIAREYPRVKLQQMQNKDDEKPDFLLTALPKADKNDYTFQWVMNNSTTVPSPPLNNDKVPSPPLKEAPRGKNTSDGRKRRFIKRNKTNTDRPESVLSEDVSITKDNILDFLLRPKSGQSQASKGSGPSIAQSGPSVIESGRETSLSMHTEASLSSQESNRVLVREDPMPENFENDIQDYFEQIAKEKIEQRNENLRRKAEKEQNDEEKEEFEKDSVNDTNYNEATNNDEGNQQDRNETSNENDQRNEADASVADDIRVRGNENQANTSNDENENACVEGSNDEAELVVNDDNESIASMETILPRESPCIEEDPNERFPTPESEPEPEEPESEDEPSVEDTVGKNMVTKWAWRTTNLIRWRHVKPVVKPGATVDDYKAALVKMKRSRFKDLSLNKPKSFSELHKPLRVRSFEVKPVDIASSNKSTPRNKTQSTKSSSPRIHLPQITLQAKLVEEYQKSTRKKSEKDQERISLPPIHQDSLKKRPAATNKVEGAWY